MPQPSKIEKLRTYEARLRKGIFLGYRQDPGGRWSGDYLVLDYDDYKGCATSAAKREAIHSTAGVKILDTEIYANRSSTERITDNQSDAGVKPDDPN